MTSESEDETGLTREELGDLWDLAEPTGVEGRRRLAVGNFPNPLRCDECGKLEPRWVNRGTPDEVVVCGGCGKLLMTAVPPAKAQLTAVLERLGQSSEEAWNWVEVLDGVSGPALCAYLVERGDLVRTYGYRVAERAEVDLERETE